MDSVQAGCHSDAAPFLGRAGCGHAVVLLTGCGKPLLLCYCILSLQSPITGAEAETVRRRFMAPVFKIDVEEHR
jgi:hypothetical protein